MKGVFSSVVALVALSSARALAAPGEAGQLAVGAERLTGYSYTRQTSEDDYGKVTVTYGSFHLLANGYISTLNLPRVALDYFATDGLSLGGSLSYIRIGLSSEAEPAGGGASISSDGTISLLLIAPRVGYAVMFSDGVGIWPRGGITYLRSSVEGDDGAGGNSSVTALTVEAPLLLTPVENVAFTLGPTIDFGLSTSSESEDADGNTTNTGEDDNPPHQFGLEAGLTVFF